MHPIRLILNGKKAGLEAIRTAVNQARARATIEVRVTWEAGDVARFVDDAIEDGCKRIMIGGGDGSVKEVVDALMQHSEAVRPELAILPLGTANDFASACGIPEEISSAIKLAQQGNAVKVDSVKANDEYFINVASGGFGAHVTANTPVALKNFLGGGAYTLSGLVQGLNFTPCAGKLVLPEQSLDCHLVASAVCNGQEAGGGQQLAPMAKINDGLLDIVALLHTTPDNYLQVLNELMDPKTNGEFVKRFRTPWVQWHAADLMPINLDGEPITRTEIRFEVQPKSISLVLPPDCKLLLP